MRTVYYISKKSQWQRTYGRNTKWMSLKYGTDNGLNETDREHDPVTDFWTHKWMVTFWMEQQLQISQDKFCTMQSRMMDGEEEKEEEEENECQLKDQKLNVTAPKMMEASYSKHTRMHMQAHTRAHTHTHTHTYAHGSLAFLQAYSQIIDYFMTMCQVQWLLFWITHEDYHTDIVRTTHACF